MSHTSTNTSHLTLSQVWSDSLKTVLEDELNAQKHVRWINFGDGDVLNIPSIGTLAADDYVENTPVKYNSLDTGNFQFSVTEYKQAGTYITNKARQDLHYAAQLEAAFLPAQHRAIMEQLETDIMRVGPEGQTASDYNKINGAPHRWIGTGTNDVITVNDFARARYSLQQAKVPMTNLIAIVDPTVEFQFNTLSNFTNLIYNPKWEGVVRDGLVTGMQFKANIYGFDVYTCNWLKNGISETIDQNSVSNGVANLFFSAAGGDLNPFVGAIRQAPKVDSDYNKDLQREEYVTTMRYGLKLFRPENLVTVLTSATLADPNA